MQAIVEAVITYKVRRFPPQSDVATFVFFLLFFAVLSLVAHLLLATAVLLVLCEREYTNTGKIIILLSVLLN